MTAHTRDPDRGGQTGDGQMDDESPRTHHRHQQGAKRNDGRIGAHGAEPGHPSRALAVCTQAHIPGLPASRLRIPAGSVGAVTPRCVFGNVQTSPSCWRESEAMHQSQ